MDARELTVGDRVIVDGGYDMKPAWLAATAAGYRGDVVRFVRVRTSSPRLWLPSTKNMFTDYDDRLAELDPFEAEVDNYEYRALKQAAHVAVQNFLCAHRRPLEDA